MDIPIKKEPIFGDDSLVNEENSQASEKFVLVKVKEEMDPDAVDAQEEYIQPNTLVSLRLKEEPEWDYIKEGMMYDDPSTGSTNNEQLLLLPQISPSHGENSQYSSINNCKTRKQHLEIQAIHSEEKHFSNIGCITSSMNSQELTLHSRIYCGEKPFSCYECKKSFKSKRNLTRHSMIHSGEKPFFCKECKKSCRSKYDLIVHTRVHSGEKPFSCTVCKMSFISSSARTMHYSRIHIGGKTFFCDECNKSYRSKHDLTVHSRIIHSGEKSFPCTVCKMSFTSSEAQTKHYSRIHNGKNPLLVS